VDARDICAKTRFALLPGHDGSFKLIAWRNGDSKK
jgi:hypothetical protein